MVFSSFFPSLDFAWIFLGLLFAVLIAASGTDLRRYAIPKWITLTGLGLGIAGNLIRGLWLASDGQPVWKLGESGTFLGGVDGLLFALSGFAVGFAVFFLMWILGICGGGDVKLFAALGCWIGPYYAICVLAFSIPVVALMSFGGMALVLLRGQRIQLPDSQRAPRTGTPRPPKHRLGWSVPLTIATTLVILWVFREDLHLVAPNLH